MSTEVCDDGGLDNTSMCKSDCTGSVNGWTCAGGSSTTASTCTTNCGDTFALGTEACDDGNVVNLDGCSSTCTIEAGWTCDKTLVPTKCSPICGDG